jgi:hypothetical protein
MERYRRGTERTTKNANRPVQPAVKYRANLGSTAYVLCNTVEVVDVILLEAYSLLY